MYDARTQAQSDFDDTAAAPLRFDGAHTPRRGPDALQADVLVGMLDEIDYGLMVLGADAQILLANQLARLELGGERFVRRRHDKLVPSAARHAAKIDAALAGAGRGQRSLVTLGGSDGELALAFVPLPAHACTAANTPQGPFTLVAFGKRDACEALTLRHYARLHGLTGAEQALLPALIRGMGVEAIAQQQCVALSTVRTQLGSIRSKTGAKSLRLLMARLSSLPPIRPAVKQSQLQ